MRPLYKGQHGKAHRLKYEVPDSAEDNEKEISLIDRPPSAESLAALVGYTGSILVKTPEDVAVQTIRLPDCIVFRLHILPGEMTRPIRWKENLLHLLRITLYHASDQLQCPCVLEVAWDLGRAPATIQ